MKESMKPKHLISVLMPINLDFQNVCELAIKSAADEVGAYVERVDEQHFSESMPDILNQINKSDVIIADMTGTDPNVIYGIGYAHALEKNVILITQNISDVPFDLEHQQHIHYESKQLSILKSNLMKKLTGV